MSVSIRPMQAMDKPAVVSLLLELTDHEAGLSPDRVTGRQTAEACLADDSESVAEEGGAQIVAEREGRVIGYLAMRFGRAGSFVHEHLRDHVYVENIVVAAAHRGGGVGQALLSEVERFARASGRKVILLGVLPKNELALKAYRRAGFGELSIEMAKVLE